MGGRLQGAVLFCIAFMLALAGVGLNLGVGGVWLNKQIVIDPGRGLGHADGGIVE